ncbi:hypothetical protein BRPE64_DCDS10890 (plasmid) [Caballeronia insecticola]|uniref:Uncharacterized protein n=1 Tax=Caballeronia insecticola TaxID=758793 RepID=R4X134_9BURK|nr:hypothetical protein BRPE64_DCDS10890 [Caballeronia insecticola]
MVCFVQISSYTSETTLRALLWIDYCTMIDSKCSRMHHFVV